MEHALDCKKGGLVTQCHTEVRDVIGELESIVYKEVLQEPVVQKANDTERVPSLIADRSMAAPNCGIVRCTVTDTDAPPYSRVVTAILSSAEGEKKEENTLKQQLFAEPPSHLLYPLTESCVEKLIFLSNI